MRWLLFPLLGLVVLLLIVVGVALFLVMSPQPRPQESRDVFGFEGLDGNGAAAELPEIERFTARDGSELAVRIYPSSAERILVFVHGSSYHGAGYHDLARSVSSVGAATGTIY